MMLDSYTNTMCLDSWGRSIYARVLIEFDASNQFEISWSWLSQSLMGAGNTKEIISIEYERVY